MQKELVGCEKKREIMGLKLIPVVRSTITWVKLGETVAFYAFREPVYLLIETALGVRIWRVTGEEISLQQACSEYPSIREDLVADYSGLLTQGH